MMHDEHYSARASARAVMLVLFKSVFSRTECSPHMHTHTRARAHTHSGPLVRQLLGPHGSLSFLRL